jgi:hypothetical protein
MHILTSYSSFAMIVFGKCCGVMRQQFKMSDAIVVAMRRPFCFGEIPLACSVLTQRSVAR